MKNKKYVVVDLETTGTKRHEHDRIIQFAGVVIENFQITNQVSFLINPECLIDDRIHQLTGITNEQLQSQPVFVDVAPQIWQFLQGKVFVAHNVNFDYPFLQTEFTNAGFPELNLAAIDTVELAQVLLPTAPSFKLAELTNYLQITHDKPHQADSDAWATAKLFLQLRKRLLALPVPTMKWLNKFAKNFLRQTGEFIRDVTQNAMIQKSALSSNLVQVRSLVLQKPVAVVSTGLKSSTFPVNRKQKLKLFGTQLQWRAQQTKMMNFVHRKLTQQVPLSLINAPTGLGKTLGYLLPITYQLDQGQKLVVATSTKLLQQQLLQDVSRVEQLRQQKYSTTVISSPNDYLDLANFYRLLTSEKQHRLLRLMLLKILVWLTQTTTGNLQELNLTNYQTSLFRLIRSNGHPATGIFAPYDFWLRLTKQAEHSDLIITNHSYLLNNLQEQLFQASAGLIIDEASNLLQQTLQPQAQFEFQTTRKALKRLSDLLYQNRVLLRNTFHQNLWQSWQHADLANFQLLFDQLARALTRLSADLVSQYVKTKVPLQKRSVVIQLPLKRDELAQRTLQYLKKSSQQFRLLLEQVGQLVQLSQAVEGNISLALEQVLQQITDEYLILQQQLQQLKAILESLSIWQEPGGLVLTMLNYQDWDSLKLATQIFNQENIIQKLQTQFPITILIDATLKYHNSFHNFLQQLGLSQSIAQKNKLSLQRDFNLEERLKVYLPTDAPYPQQTTDLAQHLTQNILPLLQQNSQQTLILFNSLTLLQAVYQLLGEHEISQQREILAQSVSGSNQRVKKRFALNNQAVLLATSSFGSGVNLAPQNLKLVIVTRIPFEAPDNPFVQAKTNFWRTQGQNFFKVESLPTAARRLKQQAGRLIRDPDDCGALVLLDQRLQTSAYGARLYQDLDLPPLTTELDTEQVTSEIKMFFQTDL
ncbi:DEAD/DEAH box helicase [Bombilactobacillus folatiphilus]|uniref:3'-5' exonuclease DinG n=1 Tax=Bombilactobacillus folatiphilus TaxID=2923362 RepID=A0ABY4P779_9LACO|nr:helicase C-terminal domain-containing protein [Bombilactobacillus folatiphilus]UQS81497.1 DEAD/DEAH box helicase [Bombilactobacillus folatiphilus]